MSYLEALVLGLVQGLTEFLPISSSGHLVLVPYMLGWDQPSTTFDLVLHVGTLVAVVVYFRKELAAIIEAFIKPRPESAMERRLGTMVVVGTIPAVIAGLLLEKTFESFFSNPSEVAGFLLVTGLLLIVTGFMMEGAELAGRARKGTDKLRLKDALIIGLMQAAAIAPGISRSGATIATGLFLGFNREAAARYSFLLSIPIIAGAAAFQLRHGIDTAGASASVLAVGFLAAALSGFAAVKFLMAYIREHGLKVFAYYCWVLGAIIIIWHLVY
jgi:undecaprenyl-diphosphatase